MRMRVRVGQWPYALMLLYATCVTNAGVCRVLNLIKSIMRLVRSMLHYLINSLWEGFWQRLVPRNGLVVDGKIVASPSIHPIVCTFAQAPATEINYIISGNYVELHSGNNAQLIEAPLHTHTHSHSDQRNTPRSCHWFVRDVWCVCRPHYRHLPDGRRKLRGRWERQPGGMVHR